jgi:hypothetical protein
MAGGFFRAAASIFGGAFGKAADATDHLKDTLRGKARDDAFAKAVEEVRPKFKQCSRCGKWVCPEHCWNASRGLCEDCAPDLQEEASAAQAQAAKQQIWDKALASDQTEGLDIKKHQQATCPHCQAKVNSGKFCPECGKTISTEKFCVHCGGKCGVNAKFCPECGKPPTE